MMTVEHWFPSPSGATQTALVRRIAISGAMLLCMFSTGHGEAAQPDPDVKDARLTLRLFDYAGLERELLEGAATQAAIIFERAGIVTSWQFCRTKHTESTAASCPPTPNPATVSLRILSSSLDLPGMDAHTTYGVTFTPKHGFANMASVFWNRVSNGQTKEHETRDVARSHPRPRNRPHFARKRQPFPRRRDESCLGGRRDDVDRPERFALSSRAAHLVDAGRRPEARRRHSRAGERRLRTHSGGVVNAAPLSS
ncbi:MAG: hypothetical protein R2748_30230 [Bryobacterales bacterium]